MREIAQSLSILMLVATFLGCRGGEDFGPTGKVTGKLTMDGKPLPAGHAVSFMQMEKGFLAFGMTDAEGKFEVNSWNNGDMPIGKYDVMIAPPDTGDLADAPNLSPEERFEKQTTSTSNTKPRALIPVRYRQTTTSELQYEIKAGVNNFDIDLKST